MTNLQGFMRVMPSGGGGVRVDFFFFFSFSIIFFLFCVGGEFQPKVQKGTSKGMQSPSPVTDEENHLIHSSLLFSALGTLIIQLILSCILSAF